MGFLKNLFGAKDEPNTIDNVRVTTKEEFWSWFQTREREFSASIRTTELENMERTIFGPLSDKLGQLRDGIYFQMGMAGDDTAELVLTPEGNPKNIAFVEELIAAAPSIHGWLFTALKKPESGTYIEMNGLRFGLETLKFYPNDHEDLPDLVDITIVHDEFGGGSDKTIKNGSFLFLDNYLGELDFLTKIDHVSFSSPADATKDLIPIDALPNFLDTRAALFVEKYDGVRIFTDSDPHVIMEATHESGHRLVATVNEELLKWDKKASHPWILFVTIEYDCTHHGGLPDAETADELNAIEDSITAKLRDQDGYLNVGRDAANNTRTIYFACIEFRNASKVLDRVIKDYTGKLSINYEIAHDKYWQAVDHFRQN
ncbi:MAG: DUF695 domain-containing protein [Blastocatellia bacterium]|nr:DUF695 domain-containing protein [Blastocatellia bacterium]